MTRSGGLRAKEVLLRVLACILTTLLVAGCSGSESFEADESTGSEGTESAQKAGESAKQPNIIFILTDDLNYNSVGQMPEISSLLMEEGISFENAFISHPLCCPSRTTILTGLYEHNHNVRGNTLPDGGFQKFLSEGHEENTIAVRLQEGGYQTAFFGKYLNGYPGDDPTHVPPGWDEWYGKLDEQKLYDYRINENGTEISYGSETKDFFTDVLSRQVTDFVRSAASEDQPFFAYVAPTAPHGPATPAERHKGAFAGEEALRPPSYDEEDVSDKPSRIRNANRISDKEASRIDNRHQKRLESMLAVDDMVASLVEELEAAGELDNTYIFFTSDNGFEQGEHRIKEGKNQPYEESTRVPLFVRGPGVSAGTETGKLVLNTDFAPTFATLAGVEFPTDGRSLTPLLYGEDLPWRSAVLLEKLSSKKGKGKGKGKGKANDKGKAKAGAGGSSTFEAVRTETHKYVEYGNGETELYDLKVDPYELESLHASADPSLVEDLRTRLDALESCSGKECREAEDAS